jgi:hypothetical protein
MSTAFELMSTTLLCIFYETIIPKRSPRTVIIYIVIKVIYIYGIHVLVYIVLHNGIKHLRILCST